MKDDKLINRFAHLIREADNLSNVQNEQIFYYINRVTPENMTICIEVSAPESVLNETIKTVMNEEKEAEKVFYSQGYFDHIARLQALQCKADIMSICMDCEKNIQIGEERFPDYATNSKQVRCQYCFYRNMEGWMQPKREDDAEEDD